MPDFSMDNNSELEMPSGGNDTGLPGLSMDYYGDGMDYHDNQDYVNPFDIGYIRIIFILLYSTVFACCFIG